MSRGVYWSNKVVRLGLRITCTGRDRAGFPRG